MATLHFFNPGNDLALASGLCNYTPPAAAISLAHAGALLPLWLAEPGDFILADTSSAKRLQTLATTIRRDVKIWNGEPVSQLMPWGWSKWARTELQRAFKRYNARGFGLLTSTIDIERIEALSHRRSSILLHKKLKTGLQAIEAKSVNEAGKALSQWGDVVGKSPLSGSGRGVFYGSEKSRDTFLSRCLATIARQGSVMIERKFDPITEFAMLFKMDGSGISFAGYSLFRTSGTAYTANILLSDEDIRNKLSHTCPDVSLPDLEQRIADAMREIIGLPLPYQGYFGIDMMIYNDTGTPRINPCIEINMRATMGVISRKLHDQLLHPDSKGVFSLGKRSELPRAEWADNKLMSGGISLSPEECDIQFFLKAEKLCQ